MEPDPRSTEPMKSQSGGRRVWWAFTVVHHDEEAAIGQQGLVGPGMSVEIGRDGGLFDARTLESAKVSRRHARIDCPGGSPPRLTDLSSKNGTWLNGRPIASDLLAAGDIVRVGNVLIAVHPVTQDHHARVVAGMPARSFAMASFVASLEAIAPTVHAVRVLHEDHCGQEHIGRLYAALTASARGSRRVPKLQIERVDSLDRADPAGDDGVAVLVLPPLRERTEDLPELYREISRRAHGRVVRLHHRTALALLRAPWPGNLDELETFVRTRCAVAMQDEPVRVPEADLGRIGQGADSVAHEVRSAASLVAAGGPVVERVRIAMDGKWFELPGSARVSLAHRYVLARIVAALAKRFHDRPGECLGVDDLIAAAWPGTRFVADAGTNRLYVSLTILRRLGLRAAIQRDEAGYRLASLPDVTIEVVS